MDHLQPFRVAVDFAGKNPPRLQRQPRLDALLLAGEESHLEGSRVIGDKHAERMPVRAARQIFENVDAHGRDAAGFGVTQFGPVAAIHNAEGKMKNQIHNAWRRCCGPQHFA